MLVTLNATLFTFPTNYITKKPFQIHVTILQRAERGLPRRIVVSHVASFRVPMSHNQCKEISLSFICMNSYVAVAYRFFPVVY